MNKISCNKKITKIFLKTRALIEYPYKYLKSVPPHSWPFWKSNFVLTCLFVSKPVVAVFPTGPQGPLQGLRTRHKDLRRDKLHKTLTAGALTRVSTM